MTLAESAASKQWNAIELFSSISMYKLVIIHG
jgi:hypothetical protein